MHRPSLYAATLWIYVLAACSPASTTAPAISPIPPEPSMTHLASAPPVTQVVLPSSTATQTATPTPAFMPTPAPPEFYKGLPPGLGDFTSIPDPLEDPAAFRSIIDTLWTQRPAFDSSARPVVFQVYPGGGINVYSPGGEGLQAAAGLKFDRTGEGTLYLLSSYALNPDGSVGLLTAYIGGAQSDEGWSLEVTRSLQHLGKGRGYMLFIVNVENLAQGFGVTLFAEQAGLEDKLANLLVESRAPFTKEFSYLIIPLWDVGAIE